MPSTVLRSVLRQSQFALRRAGVRNASTTTAGTTTAAPSTVTKAKDAVSSVTSKASEGLSKVTSSAGETVSSAASAVTNATGQATGRVGRMVSTVQCRGYFVVDCFAAQDINPSCSYDSTHHILFQSRPRSRKTNLQGPRNGTSVSDSSIVLPPWIAKM